MVRVFGYPSSGGNWSGCIAGSPCIYCHLVLVYIGIPLAAYGSCIIACVNIRAVSGGYAMSQYKIYASWKINDPPRCYTDRTWDTKSLMGTRQIHVSQYLTSASSSANFGEAHENNKQPLPQPPCHLQFSHRNRFSVFSILGLIAYSFSSVPPTFILQSYNGSTTSRPDCGAS